MFASTTGKIPAGRDSQLAMPMRERDLEALTEIFDDLDTEQAENLDEAIATLSTPTPLQPWEEIGWVLFEQTQDYEWQFA